jgi:esterase/lipase
MLERWNRLLKGIALEGARLPYVENEAQFPDTNYNKIYVAGLARLLELQQCCREKLAQVELPLLVIQAEDDPVVAASSAKEIIDKVSSLYKSLEYLPLHHHVIVRGEGSRETFQLIDPFIASL